MKECSRGADCVHPNGPYLPSTEFYRRKTSKDGLYSECKACHQADMKPYMKEYNKRPDVAKRRNARQSIKYRNNTEFRERMKAAAKRSYERTKSARTIRAKQRYHNDPKYREYMKDKARRHWRINFTKKVDNDE